jgi:hypothetical protein
MIFPYNSQTSGRDSWSFATLSVQRGLVAALFALAPVDPRAQEAARADVATPQVGAAAPRVMGQAAGGRTVTPRADPFYGPAGTLESQLNAPYIPPLLSFEVEESEGMDSTWYDFDEQMEQFQLSQGRPFDLTAVAYQTLLYDFNRQLVGEGRRSDSGGLFSLLGGSVLMAYGEPGGRLRFDISYALALISNWSDELVDSANQYLGASLRFNAAKTALSLSLMAGQQPFNSLDLGGNVETINLTAEAIMTHQLSPKWSLGSSMRTLNNLYEVNEVQDLSRNLIGAFADYQLRPKVSTGFGYNFGFTEFGGSSQEQISHQVVGRLGWDAGNRLQLGGSLGVDRTSSGDLANVSSIWDLTASYRLGAKSNLSMSAFRRVMPSVAIENQFFYSTGVMFGAGTQLTDRFSIGASGGFQVQDYLSVEDSVLADREDLLINLGLRFGYRLGSRTQMSLFYQYFSNQSTGQDARPLEGGQLGLTVSIRF